MSGNKLEVCEAPGAAFAGMARNEPPRQCGKESSYGYLLLTAVALIAFAGNSLLCRIAVKHGLIDALSFSSIRLVSAAAALCILMAALGKFDRNSASGDWLSASMLFMYAMFFGIAYVGLDTGAGALILFGFVQLTMFSAAFRRKEQFSAGQYGGFALSIVGLVYLLAPRDGGSLSSADTVLMAVAGVAWGIYSLRGSAARSAIQVTTGNFLRTVPAAVGLSLVFISSAHITPSGFALALLCGALTSGCGYVVWYAALEKLSAGEAATTQLAVPVLAAFGGVLVLGEPLTKPLIISSILILGGIALVVGLKKPATKTSQRSA